jgi:hypothetical protein
VKWLWLFFAVGCETGGFVLLPGDLGAADADPSLQLSVFDDSPDGGDWRAVWGSGPNDVHVVGLNGRVLAWDGQTAVLPNLGSANDLYGLWGSGTDELWAVGTKKSGAQAGVIFRLSGDTWVQFGTTKFGLRSVWGAGDQRYAVGLSGAVYNGSTAAPFATGMQIDPNPNIPQTPDIPILYSIGGNNLMSILVAGDVDSTYYFDTRWHAYVDPVDPTRAFRAIWGPAGGSISLYEGANYFGLWYFTGPGDPVIMLNEEQAPLENFNRSIWSIWGVDDTRVVAVGDAGRIMTYDRATQAVKVRGSPTTRSLYGVWGSSFDDVWIVGEGGLILRGRISF